MKYRRGVARGAPCTASFYRGHALAPTARFPSVNTRSAELRLRPGTSERAGVQPATQAARTSRLEERHRATKPQPNDQAARQDHHFPKLKRTPGGAQGRLEVRCLFCPSPLASASAVISAAAQLMVNSELNLATHVCRVGALPRGGPWRKPCHPEAAASGFRQAHLPAERGIELAKPSSHLGAANRGAHQILPLCAPSH